MDQEPSKAEYLPFADVVDLLAFGPAKVAIAFQDDTQSHMSISVSMDSGTAKKTILTDAERAKRICETAREIGTDNDPELLEHAFQKVVRPKAARQDRDAPKSSGHGRTSRLR